MSTWTTPDWLKPYLPHITDSRRLEELYTGKTRIQINAPLALHELTVQAEVDLLHRLHAAGLLKEPIVERAEEAK